MKLRILFIILLPVFITSCGPSTVITATWKSQTPVQNKYTTIIVAALTSNIIAKETLENDIASALQNSTIVLKSITEFPPDISNSDTNKVMIMNKVKDKNVDAILTVSLINKETESHYVPGDSPYDPLSGYSYYNNFWGYYSYLYPYAYSQGYYIQEKVYFIETNLYDAVTEKLIWSAQSKTYTPADLKSFSKEFSNIIVSRLKKDGIITGVTKTAISKQ